MILARLPFWIFHRHRLQQHRVNGGLDTNQAAQSHPQVGHNNAIGNKFASYYSEANGLQSHVSYSLPKSLSNDGVQKYEWGVAASNGGCLAFYGRDYFGDLSARLNGVNHHHTLSLKARFGRSCRAFVNAWRAP